MKKVLILGGSGLVGYTLAKKFKEYNWRVSALTFQREVEEADETIHLDLSDAFSFNEIPDPSTFDLVVNSLAITDVKSNETRFIEAFTLHVELSRYLAKRSPNYVYISTVAVYSETLHKDKNVNITLTNWYSKTKFFGEPNSRYLVLRINVIGLESLTKRSLLEWAYDNLKRNNEITGFENQFINPVLPIHVFEVIMKYSEKLIAPGVYDLGSEKIVSKYSLMQSLAKLMGKENYLKKGRSGVENKYQITRSENTLIVNFEFKDYVSGYLDEIKRA
ncbi:sugar nucleotide-binding protein [Schleiferiaceae bacterium]|nr:sugar nucleotide-binding protein [Schleiferiaceae bacterium]